ncbi:hypothetical protein V6N13_124769 [Hibiscus sabdariffa]
MFQCQCAYEYVEFESHSSSEGGKSSFPEPIEVTPKIDNNVNNFVQKGVDEENQSSIETIVPLSLTPMAKDNDWLADEVDGLVSLLGEAYADQRVIDYVHEVDFVSMQYVDET